MSIYFDSTEQRANTRLPEAVLKAGQSVIGLEAATGADLLISTLSDPALPAKLNTENKRHALALRKHLGAGMLVQRKSGLDFTNSIPDLANIIRRMRECGSELNWLLVVGDIKRSREGQCVIDGNDSGYTWAAVQGAMEFWQLRGGYISILPGDSLIPQWVNGWLTRLADIQAEPVRQIVSRVPAQVLTGPDWRSVLCALPGIGPDTAHVISERVSNLAEALCLLTDPSMAGTVAGVGKGRIASVRRMMQLPEGVRLALMGLDDEVVTAEDIKNLEDAERQDRDEDPTALTEEDAIGHLIGDR